MFPHFGEKFAKDSIRFGVGPITAGSAILRMHFTDRVYRQFGPWRRRCAELICQSSKGGLAAVPAQVHHLAPATIKDLACIADGADYCEWEFTWTPHHRSRLFGSVGAIASGGLGFAAVRLSLPEVTIVVPLVIALLAAGLWGVASTFRTLQRTMTGREKLIQEQLHSVEARHEELREAYLQQEQTTVDLRRKVNQLAALHQAGLLFNSTLDREGLVQRVLQSVVQDLHYDRALISFFDRERGVVHRFRFYGVSEEVAAYARALEVPVTDPHSAEGMVLLQGQSICVGDIRELWDRLHPLHRQLALMTKAQSWLCVPLKVNDRILGALTVDRANEQSLTQDDLDVMTTLAGQVAIALDNADAYYAIEELKAGLEARVMERTAALEESKKKLEVANSKLKEMDEEKSDFLATVAHELRTPMTSIKGCVENMLDGLAGPVTKKQRQYLTLVRDNSERLTRMVSEQLDRSRIEAGQVSMQRGAVSMTELVGEVLQTLQSLAQVRSITLAADPLAAIPPVLGDRDKLQQVLINLVQNAITFSPDGGTVRIHAMTRADGSVHISVADTGLGIPEHERDKVFRKFFRGESVPARARGAGLGLAITKNLVELHGGQLWVEGQPEGGSCFSFTIPMASASDRPSTSEGMA